MPCSEPRTDYMAYLFTYHKWLNSVVLVNFWPPNFESLFAAVCFDAAALHSSPYQPANSSAAPAISVPHGEIANRFEHSPDCDPRSAIGAIGVYLCARLYLESSVAVPEKPLHNRANPVRQPGSSYLNFCAILRRFNPDACA